MEKALPKTLIEAIRYFADADMCVSFVAGLRWPDGRECPSCGGKDHSYITTRRVWKCKACKKQFSVKVGTVFEDSPIPLDKWLAAIWMIANSKNGVSSHEMARSLGITQKSAWFVLHRVRLAMQTGTFQKFDGTVEVDETFIGGKARNMHKQIRRQKITGTGGKDKTAVAGVLQRGGEVRAHVVADRTKPILQNYVRSHVEEGSHVYTDSLNSYSGLDEDYDHEVVDHAEFYVNGKVHTNGIENFWSLLKRGLRGTYVSVEPFHLFRYLDERAFTYNRRKANDMTRFRWVLGQVAGRRLTYAHLTGKA